MRDISSNRILALTEERISYTFCFLIMLFFLSSVSVFAVSAENYLPRSLEKSMIDSNKNNPDKPTRMEKEGYYKLPLYFIQNNGQMDERIKFYEDGGRHATFFTNRGIYFSFVDNQYSDVVKLTPLGIHKTPKIIAEDLQKNKINYFTGNDPGKWKANVPTYRAITYKGIYEGIDIRFYGNNRQLEYDIIIKPGADSSCIKFACSGIEDLTINEEGNLEIYLKGGKFIQKKPYVYQEIKGKRIEIDGRFKVKNSKIKDKIGKPEVRKPKSKIRNRKFTYGFQVASYDKRYSLIIDPILVYSTYFGGGGQDCGRNIAVDPSGNVYITGETWSHDFVSYESKAGEVRFPDAFVTKIDASGNSLLYSTYLGGSSDDVGRGIAVDTSGNAYITGVTNSTDFPTSSAISKSKRGGADAFVTKLDASGNLIYSTYLGGDNFDWGNGIAIDASQNAYVTGWTSSQNFPVTSATYKSTSGGYRDGFVTKLGTSGATLVYSTYLGGNNDDAGNGIAVDISGNAYITGYTNSTNFPTVSAACGDYAGGYHDAFVAKLNASGKYLIYSTYLGGNNDDVGYGIAIDTSGNAYITGVTWSTNFPTVSSVYKSLAGNNDAFIIKLNPLGNNINYSTYLGGSMYDGGYGIVVDASRNVYVTGVTCSHDFPVTSSIYKNVAGNDDAFITKLNSSGNSVICSTYLGGNENDVGYGITVDTFGSVYVTGQTWSDTFPTASAIYRGRRGDNDVFIAKMAFMENKIHGYVADSENNPIESVSVRLKGIGTISSMSTSSNAEGFFEFEGLDMDTYIVSAIKNSYKETEQKVKVEKGKMKIIVIKMKKEN